MYDIQLNESGSRHLEITEENLLTIGKYNLFDGLIGSPATSPKKLLKSCAIPFARSSSPQQKTPRTYSTSASMSSTTTR